MVDKGPGFGSIAKELEMLAKKHVRVGIVAKHDLASKGKGVASDQAVGYNRKVSRITLVEKALFHEVGTRDLPKSPPRSFIAHTVDKNTVRIENMQAEAVDRVLADKQSAMSAMREVGSEVAQMMRNTIIQQDGFRPLKDTTLDARRRNDISGSRALLATHQIFDAIGFDVERD